MIEGGFVAVNEQPKVEVGVYKLFTKKSGAIRRSPRFLVRERVLGVIVSTN